MKFRNVNKEGSLSGRIKSSPNQLLHKEILEPQFNYEIEYLLDSYIQIEKVLLVEYESMEVLSHAEVSEIASILDSITAEVLIADPNMNMSDISFAIEKYTVSQLKKSIPSWHVDRSRNDFQACAQMMAGREQLLAVAETLLIFGRSVQKLAADTVCMPMPGYTHYQPAQIITPGFYLSAISEHVNNFLSRLLVVYDDAFKSPLGAGAMSGQELNWNRTRMANLLGFDQAVPHALMSVASRDWVLRVSAEFSNFCVSLSRFTSDLIIWGSSEYGFIDLPDSLAGISSSMPQKKNFPILERIRGKTAHISSYYFDFVLSQRNTAYTNLVETSKEAGTHVITMFETFHSLLRLFTVVIDQLKFQEERLHELCENEFFGGFSLANMLTLQKHIPYRTAQVVSGQYILELKENGMRPTEVDTNLLISIAGLHGFQLKITPEEIRKCFCMQNNLYNKESSGSTNPEIVKKLLETQSAQLDEWLIEWSKRKESIIHANSLVEKHLFGERKGLQ